MNTTLIRTVFTLTHDGARHIMDPATRRSLCTRRRRGTQVYSADDPRAHRVETDLATPKNVAKMDDGEFCNECYNQMFAAKAGWKARERARIERETLAGLEGRDASL